MGWSYTIDGGFSAIWKSRLDREDGGTTSALDGRPGRAEVVHNEDVYTKAATQRNG